MIIGSKDLIRDINSTNVLETIIASGAISRAAIAKHLGITKATISAIVQDLIDKKLVQEIGNEATGVGRKPILLSINKDAGYAISIDLGVEHLSALLTNLQGERYFSKKVKTPTNKNKIYPLLITIIDSLMEQAKEVPYGLIGIALGIHGVTKNNQVIFAPYYDISTLNLHEQLTSHYNTQVYLENEANLSVIGEKTFNYNYPNIANINVHSGIGLGLIINNSLYTGFSGHAGELGHTIIEVDGKECPCGNKGCLEQYVSERVLLNEYSIRKGLPTITVDEFASMYRQGDQDALDIIDKFIHYMTVCVNNVLNLYNPDIIIINSSLIRMEDSLLLKIQNSLSSHMNSYNKLVPSALKDSSILLGGICICIKKFLGVKNFDLNVL